MRPDPSRLADPWLRDFPAPTDEEVAKYREGTHIPQFAALALYNRRTRVAMGPAKMLFDALIALPEVTDAT